MLTQSPRPTAIEAVLHDLIPRLAPPPNRHGRPEVLPGALLWTALLVGILRGQGTQQGIWRLLSQSGLWDFPRVPVGAEAVRIRLRRAGSGVVEQLFRDVSAELAAQVPTDDTLAPFAGGVYALDETTLDQTARTVPALRGVPAGDARLLPGKLITAFDVRRQQFHTVQTTELPHQNEKVAARDLVATLPVHSLVLADLGYFGFEWFDDLTDAEHHFVSRLRAGTSVISVQTLAATDALTDELIWLGAHRSDRAKHLYRRVRIRRGVLWHSYLTNVRDPATLPAVAVDRLYSRRWDIELAFKTIKRDLGLHLVWSAQWELILTQVWGVLLIAQIAAALRHQIARCAEVDLFDVSLTLLLRDLPYLTRHHGAEVVAVLAALPRVKGGYIRPARRGARVVPDPGSSAPPRPNLPLTRKPRYAGRKCGPSGTDQRPTA
jgi:hypothetical protein